MSITTTIRRPAVTGRRPLGALRGLLTTIRRPSDTPAPVAEQAVTEPTGLFAADELPPLGDIAAAAREYMAASEQTRAADRAKRAAKKLLDRLPASRYGVWQVERVANAREVADLESIRETYKALGLGPVPMKPCAPSLKVVIVPELANIAGLVAAA